MKIGFLLALAINERHVGIGVGDSYSDFVVAIYPNPVAEQLSIHIFSAPLPITCTIFDLNGRIVKAFEIATELQWFTVADLPAGNYVVSDTDALNQRVNNKIMKQ